MRQRRAQVAMTHWTNCATQSTKAARSPHPLDRARKAVQIDRWLLTLSQPCYRETNSTFASFATTTRSRDCEAKTVYDHRSNRFRGNDECFDKKLLLHSL